MGCSLACFLDAFQEQRLSERVSKNRVHVPDSEVLKIREGKRTVQVEGGFREMHSVIPTCNREVLFCLA